MGGLTACAYPVQSELSRIMRYYCSGILTGTAIGIIVGGLLDRKLGWLPGDPRSYLLCVLLLFAGVWLAAAQIPQFKFATGRSVVAGLALAISGLLLIVATHWGHFG